MSFIQDHFYRCFTTSLNVFLVIQYYFDFIFFKILVLLII